jgi:hypothetical protein
MKGSQPAKWLALASAFALAGCATADLRQGIVRHETPRQIWQKFHGPTVRIRTEVVWTHESRMIQPVVSVRDSAWLVIGDIGDDGTLRIVYPQQPGENHPVMKPRTSFDGPRFQPRIVLPFQSAMATVRTAPGVAFVIASSAPLDLSKLADGDRWSVFDVYYDNHMNDPRPAIADLAASIATNVGEISISYVPYPSGIVGPRGAAAERVTPGAGTRRRLPRPPG